jgi:glycerol kinase
MTRDKPPRYILALDQGTSSSRAVVFNHQGEVVAMAQQALTQHFPQPSWVEHDAMEIWHSQLSVAQAAISQLGALPSLAASPIAAMGITNQRETTVIWNRHTGQPIHRAIVWQDRRTALDCERLRAQGHAPLIQAKTGLVLDAYFSASKIAWLLDNVPGARAMAEAGELAFGTMDTWLLWNLTRGEKGSKATQAIHATDVSNASRTMLWNIHTKQWDDDLLALFRIPRALLAEVRPSSAEFGEALQLGGVPIMGMAGDQQAAAFGQACWQAGMVKNTYGTGCFMLCNTGAHAVTSQHHLLSSAAWQLSAPPISPTPAPMQYCLEGSVFMAGATIQWLRDELGIIQHAQDVEALAASVPDNGGVMLVPAHTGLGAPYWDATARGTILGLTRGSNKSHIARAALEGIAHQVCDVLSAMQADLAAQSTTNQDILELRVDGGASQNNLLMQLQANLLQVPVVRPKVTETTALGAAYLAGLAMGFWASQDELAQFWQIDRRFEPEQGSDAWQRRERVRWAIAVEKSRGWA